MSKFTYWAVTFSTAAGIPKDSCDMGHILKWAEKRSNGRFALAWEAKVGGHVHIALCLPTECSRSNLLTAILRMAEKKLTGWDSRHTQRMRMTRKPMAVSIMFNMGWLEKYMEKREEEGDQMMHNSFPAEEEITWPDKPEEREVVADWFLDKMEKAWYNHCGDQRITMDNVAIFMNKMINVWHEARGIPSARKMKDTCIMVKRYLLKYDGAELWGDLSWCNECEHQACDAREEVEMAAKAPRYMEEY